MTATAFAASIALLVAMGGGSGSADRDGEKIRSVKLDTPVEIQGVLCARRVFYNPDGTLRTCILGRDTTFANGRTLPEGAQVSFDGQRLPDVVFLPGDAVLDGHLCAGEGPGEMMTTFYPSGRLKFCNLTRPTTVQGVPCQKTTFWIALTQGHSGVYFHENGALDRCLLAEDATVDGRALKAKQVVALDREGKLVSR